MLRGQCPKCGLVCFGWALQNKRYQTCRVCGTMLEIRENNDHCTEADGDGSNIESDRLTSDENRTHGLE